MILSYAPLLTKHWYYKKEQKRKLALKMIYLHADLLPTSQGDSMMFTIDGERFFSFTKVTWIGDLGTPYHITNDHAGLYEDTNINELVQSSSGSMPVHENKASGWK